MTSGSFVARGSTYRQPRSRRYRRGPPRRLRVRRVAPGCCARVRRFRGLVRSSPRGAPTRARRRDRGAPRRRRRRAHADDTCGEEPTWDHAMREMCVGARHEAVVRVRVVTFRRALLCFERDPFTSTFLRPLDASVERLLKARMRRRSSWIPRVSVTRPRLGRARTGAPRAPSLGNCLAHTNNALEKRTLVPQALSSPSHQQVAARASSASISSSVWRQLARLLAGG